MKTKTVHQSVLIHATPKQVYESLINSKKHSAFTGDVAKIAPKVGGKFSCYAGYITGVNLELVPGKLIVQAWRSINWQKGHYSIVEYKLEKARNGHTKLVFTQIGVPESDYKQKSSGWKEHYWLPLQKSLAN